jgi:hypothetical protein
MQEQIQNTPTGQVMGQTLGSALVPGQAIVTGILEGTKGIISTVEQIDVATRNVNEQFGTYQTLTKTIKENLTSGAQKIVELGGQTGKALELQKEYSEFYGTNVIVSGEILESLYAISKVTGEASKDLLTNFGNVGISTKNISKEIKTVMDISQSLGVNAAAVSSKVVANLDKLNKFGFQGGVEGLSKMAAQASSLRLNMESVFSVADDLMSPEKAIELSSGLQRLGVQSSELLDPLKSLDLAQNNVEGLQDEMSKVFSQFVSLNEETGRFN